MAMRAASSPAPRSPGPSSPLPPPPRSPGPSSPLPLWFGLGLGVGLPLALIALVAIVVFRRRNASNRRARSSSERTSACASNSSSASDGVTYTQSTEDAVQQSTDHESTTSGPLADVVELGVSRPYGGAPQALDQLDQDNRGLGSARSPSLEDMFWSSPQSRRSSRSSSPVRVLLPAEIPAADITLGAELGRGGAGTVHAADWFGQAVAVKALTARSGPKEELGSREVQTELLLREATMLASLRHPSAGLF